MWFKSLRLNSQCSLFKTMTQILTLDAESKELNAGFGNLIRTKTPNNIPSWCAASFVESVKYIRKNVSQPDWSIQVKGTWRLRIAKYYDALPTHCFYNSTFTFTWSPVARHVCGFDSEKTFHVWNLMKTIKDNNGHDYFIF